MDRNGIPAHLSGGFDSLPDAEKADDPDPQQTEGQVPLDLPDLIDATGDAEDITSVGEMRGDTHAVRLVRCLISRTARARTTSY